MGFFFIFPLKKTHRGPLGWGLEKNVRPKALFLFLSASPYIRCARVYTNGIVMYKYNKPGKEKLYTRKNSQKRREKKPTGGVKGPAKKFTGLTKEKLGLISIPFFFFSKMFQFSRLKEKGKNPLTKIFSFSFYDFLSCRVSFFLPPAVGRGCIHLDFGQQQPNLPMPPPPRLRCTWYCARLLYPRGNAFSSLLLSLFPIRIYTHLYL